MTRDVFKYFKQVRSLKESASAEKARELGYEHQAKGVYIDPRTNKRYRADQSGTRFVEIEEPTSLKDRMANSPAGRAETEREKQTLGDFKQKASAGREDLSKDLPTPGVDPDLDAEMKAKASARGMWPNLPDANKEAAIAREKEKAELAQVQAEEEPQEEEESQVEEPVETEEPVKDQDDFPTIDDKVAEMDQELDELDDDEAFETEYEKFQQDVENTMKELNDRQRKMMDKKFGKFRESLKIIPSATDKKSFLASMAHAKTFEGRVNSGAGKNNLGYADVQNLEANRDRLIEGYGDGSPEQIKKFVESVRSIKVSDDFVDTSFDLLPEDFKKSLKGKGQVTNDKYVSDDKAHKDIHYLGKNPDGTIKRGMASTNDRAKLMWRIYLEQGGRDAYTGLPLDIQSMDLEHVRGFNNKDGGKPGKTEWEQRENDDNMTLINSNINQTKVDLSMKDFFEQRVDPDKDKSEEDFGGIEKIFDKQNEIMSVGEELSKTLLGEGGKGLGNEVTRELLLEHFGADDTRYGDLREEFKKVATDPKDKKKAAGMKSKMGKSLLKATGLSRGITDPSGRRTVALQENVYRGFLQSMAGAKPADRQRYMDGWAEAIKSGNEERTPKAVNRKLLELGLIDQDILDNKKTGRVFREDLQYLDRMNGRKRMERLKRSLRDI
jgi:hypothetical protein